MNYKVVSSYMGVIRSAIAHNTPWELIYSQDTWTEARVGGILVFDSLEAAAEFAKEGFDCCEVYECECEEPIDLPVGRLNVVRLNTASRMDMKDLWMYTSGPTELPKWPAHTCAFKRIKLTKLVHKSS